MEACFVAGADPELMIRSPKGELVSAIGLVPGTKKRPKKVKNGAVQRDNVMAEFNIAPANSSEEFKSNIRDVLAALAKIVHPNKLVVQASANFPESALESAESKVFGCDPDFDSWALAMNRIDGTAAFSTFRSAGGHLHIGKRKGIKDMLEDPYGKVEVVKMLDIFVGIPSIFMDPDKTAPARRALYGKAGAHRPKPYGVEYRALGNFWVRSPALTDIVYALADVAVRLCADGKSGEVITLVGGPDVVQETINQSKKVQARKIFGGLHQFIPHSTLSQLAELDAKTDLYDAWGL
jgi:hypothetical protein